MMVKAVASATFRDLDCGVIREAGDVFEVTPERLERINSTRYGRLAVEVPTEDEPKATPEAQNDKPTKRRSRKG